MSSTLETLALFKCSDALYMTVQEHSDLSLTGVLPRNMLD